MGEELNGKLLAGKIREKVKERIVDIKKENPDFRPALHFIQVGGNKDGEKFKELTEKAIIELGLEPGQLQDGGNNQQSSLMGFGFHLLDSSVTKDELHQLIDELNADPKVSAILIVQPLKNKEPISLREAIERIHPLKDVEGLRYDNFEKLQNGEPWLEDKWLNGHPWLNEERWLAAPSASAFLSLIKSTGIRLSGKHAVVISHHAEGLPTTQGNPAVHLLRSEGCAVTYLDPHMENAASISKLADVVVAVAGKSKQVNSNWIKNSQTVVIDGVLIDEDGNRTGYVDTDDVKLVTKWVSPVIGGIGPVSIVELLLNTVKCAFKQQIQQQQHI